MSMKKVTITGVRFDETGKPIRVPVGATLLSTISKKILSEVKAWRSVLRLHAEEDASWDWLRLIREHRPRQRGKLDVYEYGVLRCQGRTQGIMILEVANHWNRVDEPLVYVEYLAVAPWNRPGIQHPREFAGCGQVLVRYAVERSLSFGYEGRVGLHSLPGARPFYLGLGFKDFGADPDEGGLNYLELDD
jgi:hypothetical protein